MLSQRFSVVRIPRDCILSVRSSSVSEQLEFFPYGRLAQFNLAAALCIEILVCHFFCDVDISLNFFSNFYHRKKDRTSRWWGYLQSLPLQADLPMFWDGSDEDTREAVRWMRGTDVERISVERDESGLSTLVCMPLNLI